MFESELLLFGSLWIFTAVLLNPVHHCLVLFGVVSYAPIKV